MVKSSKNIPPLNRITVISAPALAGTDAMKLRLKASWGAKPKYKRRVTVDPDLLIPGKLAIPCTIPNRMESKAFTSSMCFTPALLERLIIDCAASRAAIDNVGNAGLIVFSKAPLAKRYRGTPVIPVSSVAKARKIRILLSRSVFIQLFRKYKIAETIVPACRAKAKS